MAELARMWRPVLTGGHPETIQLLTLTDYQTVLVVRAVASDLTVFLC